MRTIFHQLPFADAKAQVDAADRTARRLSLTVAILAVLLGAWARSASFDVVPAIIGLGFRIAAFFTYGFSIPAGSFVGQGAKSVNLGYALTYGPLLLGVLVWAWHAAEVEAARQRRWLVAHPEHAQRRRQTLAALRAQGGAPIGAPALRGALVLIACLILIQRFTRLRARAHAGGGQDGCRSQGEWLEPWRGAETNLLSWWWPPAEWCADVRRDWLWSFQSVLPHRFLERQIRPGTDPEAPPLQVLFDQFGSHNPYDYFPYIFPAPTMWLNSILLLAMTVAVVHIILLRRYPMLHHPFRAIRRRLHRSAGAFRSRLGAVIARRGLPALLLVLALAPAFPAQAQDIAGALRWCAGEGGQPRRGHCIQAQMPDGQPRGRRAANELIGNARRAAEAGNCSLAAQWASPCQCHDSGLATAILNNPGAVCAFFGR